MNKDKLASGVFCCMLVVLGICFGFLFGYNAASSSFTVTVEPTEAQQTDETTVEESKPQGPVDLNTATEEELECLPGIGPALVEDLVAYRQENGPFTMIDQIKNVSGIGEKKFAQMKPYIKVD